MAHEHRRGLAFYKRSEMPWTLEEYNTIMEYIGEDISTATNFS